MKKTNIITIGIILLLLIGCNSNSNTTPQVEYEIGEIGPSGGLVFYDAGNYNNGWRYIEAAPEDVENLEWGCFNSPIEMARNINVGTGLDNTEAIVEFHDNFSDYYNNPSECSDVSNGTVAAKYCYDLEINGFDNWHLPSEGELQLMYENLHLNGLGNFDVNGILYWSSTEHDNNTATARDFSNGDQGWNCKQCDFGFMKVRAVRYF